MSGYVVAGYLVTFGGLGAYAARTIHRSRTLGSYLNPAARNKRSSEMKSK